MKLVINLQDSLVGRIRDAVQDGGYENARDFVTTAIENQLELEESEDASVRTLDEAIDDFDADESAPSAEEIDADNLATDGLGRQEYNAAPTVSSPDPDRLEEGPLWGQYNRLFPVKLAVRRLANVIQQQNEDGTASSQSNIQWIDLEQFQDDTAQLARNFGLTIKEHDQKKSRGRGEKLASGLPKGENAQKSMERFKAHFIGHVNRDGVLNGAPANLHFVNLSDEDVTRIGITEAGLEFAELYNPLLDGGPDADEAFSLDEREFYLQHVEDRLADEYRAMSTIAGAIADGDNRPDTLTDRVAEMNEDWTQSMAKTMRSGLISRMYELDLVGRERVGQRGTAYTLTEQGSNLLEDSEVMHA